MTRRSWWRPTVIGRSTNPLRLDGRLGAVHLAEFGAQAMAIHGGLKTVAAGGVPRPALLVSVRDLELQT